MLPLLPSTLLFFLVTLVISSFQLFYTVYLITSFFPGNATEFANLYIYNTAFSLFLIC